MNLRPTHFLTKVIGILLLFAIIQLFYPELGVFVYVILGLVSLLIAADLVYVCLPFRCEVYRTVSATVPLGVPSLVKMQVVNVSSRLLNITVTDHYPSVHSVEGLPVKLKLGSGQEGFPDYKITPLERGLFQFGRAELKLTSLFGFWNRFRKAGASNEIKVYPNYSEVMKYGILAAEQRLSTMGIRKKRHRGQGTDFHQLREFRKGDRLNPIDWKTTARYQKIISKDYQLEQDQQIFFLLDCGRRMRTFDAKLSHFDHALNAMLLLTYVASRQGDAIGMMTFAGEQRFLAPKKSSSNVNRFLNSLYDLTPTTQAADYISAVEKLQATVKKRAMVVILSNVREEDDEDLLKALKLLRKRHLVIFAALKEEVFEDEVAKPLNSFSDSLRYASLNEYLAERESTINNLRQNNITTLDVVPSKLHIEMVNKYLEIKSSSIL